MNLKVSNISQIENQKPKKNKQPKNKGFIRASYTGSLAAVPLNLASVYLMSKMGKISNLSNSDAIALKKAASQALTETGLREKGVKTIFAPAINLNIKEVIKAIKGNRDSVESLGNSLKSVKGIAKIVDFLKGAFGSAKPNKSDRALVNALKIEMESGFKNKLLGKLKPKADNEVANYTAAMIKKLQSIPQALIVKLQKNAFYLPNSNTVAVPDGKIMTSVFHEMGHAMNNNFSTVGKILQKSRPAAMMISSLVLMASLFNKRQANQKHEGTKVQKSFDFIKRNAGIISALSFIPVIAEEAMATIKGNGIAKKFLSPDLLKKVKTGNLLGLSSYVLAAISAGIVATVAVKSKDKIQAKYEAKREAKQLEKLEKKSGIE